MTTNATDLSLDQQPQQPAPQQTSSAYDSDNRLTIVEPENGDEIASTETVITTLLKQTLKDAEVKVKEDDEKAQQVVEEVVEPKTNGQSCSKSAPVAVDDVCRECVNCGKFAFSGQLF